MKWRKTRHSLGSSCDERPNDSEISKASLHKPGVSDSESKCTDSTADDSSALGYWSCSSYSSSTQESRRNRNCTSENDSNTSSKKKSKKRNRNGWKRKDVLNNSSQKVHEFDIDMMHPIIIPKNLRDHCDKNEGSYWTEPATKQRRRTSTARYGCFLQSLSTRNEAERCRDHEISTFRNNETLHEKYNKKVKKVFLLDECSTTQTVAHRRQIIDEDQTKKRAENDSVTEVSNFFAVASAESSLTKTEKVLTEGNSKCGGHSTWSWIHKNGGNKSSKNRSRGKGKGNVPTVNTDDTICTDTDRSTTKPHRKEILNLNAKEVFPSVCSWMESSTSSSDSDRNSTRHIRSVSVKTVSTDDEASLSDFSVNYNKNLYIKNEGPIDSHRIDSATGSKSRDDSKIKNCKSNTGTAHVYATEKDPMASLFGEVDALDATNSVSTVFGSKSTTMEKDYRSKETHLIEPTESPKSCSTKYASEKITIPTSNSKSTLAKIGSMNHQEGNNIHGASSLNNLERTEGVTLGSDREWQSIENGDRNFGDRPKIVYKAMEGMNRPVYKYALDAISLVCNNSYVHFPDDSVCRAERVGSVHNYFQYQQVHRLLDKPLFERTPDEESEKERLMRLQLRQRFASATSTGMSPIEFSRKLLKFWGGTLEEAVVHD